MSTRILFLREIKEHASGASDTVEQALKSSGAAVRSVWSASDALAVLSENEGDIDAALIDTTNHPDLLEFIRNIRKDDKLRDVPVILFRWAPSLLPREMAIFDFLEKNRRVLNISNCLTISETGVDELVRSIQFSVMSSPRLTRP